MLSDVSKVAVDTSITTGGASTAGGLLASDKDVSKDQASTEAKFGDIWKQIQSKYGAKAEKPREIKKTLGKDDFLRIMVTQMRNQDPTSPFKAEQMATQIAQFTSVEQLQNLNQGMAKLQNANQPLERLAMTNMIGKTVTVDRERFPHTEGQNETLNFTLPHEASHVTLKIVSDQNEQILAKDLGPMKKGDNTFGWDGLKMNTLPAKTGNYIYRVEALDKNNQPMQVGAQSQARVIGVSFEGSEPVFLVGDPRMPSKIGLSSVVRIDEQGLVGGAPLIPGAQSLAQASGGGQASPAAAAAPTKSANFFAFNKGEGSKSLDPSTLPPETREALARYETERAAAAAAAAAQAAPSPATNDASMSAQAGAPQATAVDGARSEDGAGQKVADVEKGFPNGLNE